MSRHSRIIIYPQDIALLTGRSDRYGRLILKRIKESLSKKSHQYVTIQEFANYIGIEVSIVKAAIFGDP